ncbi:hypothetical protein NL108_007450 [Boleophthalmus pectinirostris]|uniref:uncharacterized protein LOC110158174 n=1 Tax=Boleophthalmus pectinirostris TaxID=150288 RepID=UPI00242B9B4B|nr:uncharacterized protein LOC110158174 [Boleophthalmus pectinirostris]KAJ0056431.1 hypothetical protein NL108_007450 [Boleophthalmus pectinirostris]
MFSTTLVVLPLLWLSLASASHFFGGLVNYRYKSLSNGRIGVELRNKATFRSCGYQYGSCYGNWYNCGYNDQVDVGVIDRSNNGPPNANTWCQTETVVTKVLPSDKPFQTREFSCCWIYEYPNSTSPSWSVLTSVDLGKRSDTKKPNNSPDIGILPFLRVPQNCKRTYKPMAFDPDGDVVRCRYGKKITAECDSCKRHAGFQVDEATCTLHYLASGNQAVYEFELVVEDFPRKPVMLSYSDGTKAFKYARTARRKRAVTTTTTAFPTTTTAVPTTTTTTAPTTPMPWWYYWWTKTAPPTTTTVPTTTTTTTAPTTTTSAPPTPMPWWYYWRTTTAPPTTTTAPTTTTSAPPTPMPWWYYWRSTTTTTTSPPTTTTAPTTSVPYWYRMTSTTTSPPTTTTSPPTTTTSPPTTTTAPTTTAPLTTTTTYSTAALSLLPMQFVVYVDPPVPTCAEGYYLPKYVSPTPRDGEVILAEAGKEVEIKVKAKALYSQVDDLIMTGPLNITKHKTTGDEFTIRWTPIPEDFGHYFPICFAVEFKNGSYVYQTEMRCVLVKVTKNLVNTVVTCLESSMIVEVEKATLPPLHYQDLRLSDPSNTACSLQTHSNSTHVVARVPLNACGTQIEEDDDELLFMNEITTVDNTSALITRKHLLEIKFCCQYSKRGNVTATFKAHRENVTVWDKGFGKFNYGIEFFPDQRFVSRIDPWLYPLEYDVGDRIFMEIEATTIVNNTELFVESCRAAPYDNPNYPHPYTLIENGCNLDSTLIVYPRSHKRQFKFSFEAFKFIGLHDQVYISCSVLMCEAGNPHTRCSQGCLPNAPRRNRREAAIETGVHYVSQGPLRLKRSVQAENTGLNLNLVFITGCALAAVGMICGVFFYKAKKSSVKYQVLPSDEN